MDDWESAPAIKKRDDQWYGEDVEEEVMDSWEQDVETEDKKTEGKPMEVDKAQMNNSKKHELNQEENDDENPTTITDNGKKIALREEQEMNEIVGDVFGVENMTSSSDFDNFKHQILSKIEDCQKNSFFVEFVENLVSGLCNQMSSADTKRIHNILGNLHLEKCKADKSNKPSKNKFKLKAKLRVDNEIDIRSFEYCEDFYRY